MCYDVIRKTIFDLDFYCVKVQIFQAFQNFFQHLLFNK